MTNPTDDRSVCVVIPMPNDPPWELFGAISDDIPIIVCDDSNRKLTAPSERDLFRPPPRRPMRASITPPYLAQRPVENFGHYWAYKEGFDHRSRLRLRHPRRLGRRPPVVSHHRHCSRRPVAQGGWVNSIENDEFYALSIRISLGELSQVIDTTASGEVSSTWASGIGARPQRSRQVLEGAALRPGPARTSCIALGNIRSAA